MKFRANRDRHGWCQCFYSSQDTSSGQGSDSCRF